MDLKVKQFLLINGTLVVLVVIYMIWGRSKARRPSSLNLRKESAKIEAQSKELSVIFQFNGHDFEAYEVLGLPAGSSLEKVEQAYHEARSELSGEEQEILHMAYGSITKK